MEKVTKWGSKYAKKADVFASTPYWKREAAEVVKIFKTYASKTSGAVLDLGCNTGRFISILKEGAGDNGNTVYGVDVNIHGLRVAKERHPDCQFFETPEGITEEVGFTAFIHTINQVEDLDKLMDTVWDKMKAGGVIVVVTHNPLPSRLRKPLNLFNGYKPDSTMVREPTRGELKQLMYEYGFQCKQAYYFGPFPIPFLRRRMIYVGTKPEV